MNMYTIGLVISLLVYLLVGAWAGRKVKHLDDFFVAGRQAPALLIVGTLVASLMSTNAFMGETGTAYGGFPMVTIHLTAINIIGYVLGALLFGRYLRRSRSLTVAAFFGLRFNSARVQAIAGVTLLVGCTAYLFIICQGAAEIIVEVSDVPFFPALVIVWLAVAAFTLYSGSQGVILTDTIMFLLFSVVAFVGLGFIVSEAGGWFESVRVLAAYQEKPGIISWRGALAPDAAWENTTDLMGYAIVLGIAWGAVVAVSPWQASRYLIARDEHTVIRSAALTGAIVMILYTVLMMAGAAVNLHNPNVDPEQENMIWAAMNVMPPLVGVLMMTGIMAAGLSSASTFLSLSGFSASNDIFPAKGDDQSQLRRSRVVMLLVGLIALVLAAIVPRGNMYWITYFAGTLFASAWGPVAFMSIWSTRITEAAAFWGILAGFIANLLARTLAQLGLVDFPVVLHPIVLGALVSYLTIEGVIRLSHVSDKEKRVRAQLHETPASEMDAEKLQRTELIANLVMAAGGLASALMVFFYVLPYQDAIGRAAVGEWISSLSVGIAIIACGWLARRGARRSYTPG